MARGYSGGVAQAASFRGEASYLWVNGGKIRGASFAEGDLPALFNREVSLLTKEIDAYNEARQTPVDEEELARGWKLSGLKRP